MATESKTSVQRSATVSVKDTTVDDITAAAKKVGAPTSSRVTTGGAQYTMPTPGNEGEEVLPYSVTFTWTEEV